MAIFVADKKLKKKVYGEIGKFENMAVDEYKKGNMDLGKAYEEKADKLYANNYKKIWKKS